MQVQEDVHDFLHMLELRHGVKLPPGRNPNIRFMAHLWEPLRVLPKPLLMYLTSEAVGLATDAALRVMGFKLHRCQVLRMKAAVLRHPGFAACSYRKTDRLICL